VGGGTAGLVVATRLSQELPNQCILVIEAGLDGRNESKIYIPGLRGSTFGSVYDWNLATTPQEAANNRSITHNRGKVLGGSSALNLLIWNRASSQEYDVWEKLGNRGWNWESMFPEMLSAENFQRKNGVAQYGEDGVSYGGPVETALLENPPPHVQACIPTLESLGLEQNMESLNGDNLGTMYQPATHRLSNHTRSYSVDYLPRAGSNLVLMTNTSVAKLELSKNGTSATGVVLTSGKKIYARNEVILSAGSLLSPKILELSGIGRKDVLANAGIEQKVDLPGVGENLQDHLRIQTTYELRPNITGLDILRYNQTRAAIELELWRQNQTSLYQYSGSCYGFLKWHQTTSNNTKLLRLAQSSADPSNAIDRMKLSLLSEPTSRAPDLQVVFGDGYIGTRGYPANTTSGYGKKYATLLGGIMHPFARGSVHISSAEASANPTIDPRYLSNEFDLEAAKQAAKYLRRMGTTSPFKELWVREYDPGFSTQSDEQWETYVRENVSTFYHPLGTCAMLPKVDGGVVDPELRVYGVRNLRVVDASVIPIMISANIQTAVYGIAERAAGIIAAEYR
jgi:choline dehydrogenase-like flavoprotein